MIELSEGTLPVPVRPGHPGGRSGRHENGLEKEANETRQNDKGECE